jgi:hypothetical protein
MIRELTPPSVNDFILIGFELVLHYDRTRHNQVIWIDHLIIIFGQ